MLWPLILVPALGMAEPLPEPSLPLAERIAQARQQYQPQQDEGGRPSGPPDLHLLSLAPHDALPFQAALADGPSGWPPLPPSDYPIVAVPSPGGWLPMTAAHVRRGYLELHAARAAERLAVGSRNFGTLQAVESDFSPPKPNDALQQRLLRLNPNDDPRSAPLGGIGQMIDVTSFDMTAFQADVVTLLAPTGSVQPFAAIAHQYDELDIVNRYGIGAGTRWTISRQANFGTQLLIFPKDRPGLDADDSHTDLQFMTRLEVNF